MYKLPVIIIQVIMTNYIDLMATADSKWMVISLGFQNIKVKQHMLLLEGWVKYYSGRSQK